MGFFGNINKALNGFGIYLAKEPIITKKDIVELNPNRKFPHSFNERIEGSLNSITNMCFASRDLSRGIELCKFSHSHPTRGILGYNGMGLQLVGDLADDEAEQAEQQHCHFTLMSDEVVKEVKYVNEMGNLKAL
jgi:hypothetical protein